MSTSPDHTEADRTEADHCFVCGPRNPSGLQLTFKLDGDVCRGEFTPSAEHCGYHGITHGGILFSVLDDVMANWLFLQGSRAYTAKCEVRFRHALPTGSRILLEARCVKQRRQVAVMTGRAVRADTDQVVAESQAHFMIENT